MAAVLDARNSGWEPMAGSLEANKVIGAVLTAGVVFMGAVVLSELLYRPGTIAENAFPISTGDDTDVADAAPEEEAVPLPVLLAAADPADGEGGFRACAACHTPEEGGANRVGPNLWDVIGRDIASHEGFNYSDALSAMDGPWTYENMFAFLERPQEWAPGTSMSYAGIRDPEDRAAMVAYLRSLSSDPAPLPEAEAAAVPEDEAAGATDGDANVEPETPAEEAADAEAGEDETEAAAGG